MDNLRKLSHEKLDVYQKAIEFLALAAKVNNDLPRGNSDFAIARGSALENGAIFDACRVLKLVDDSVYFQGKKLLVAIVSMLSKLW